MPCHTDPIPPGKDDLENAVEIVNDKIKFRSLRPKRYSSHEYMTLKEYLTKAKKRFETFHYKRDGSLIVLISPCPKKC